MDGEKRKDDAERYAQGLLHWLSKESSATHQKILDDETPAQSASSNRRGRRKANYETQQSEAELVAKWQRAMESGVCRADFAKDHKMSLRDFLRLLERVRKRK